MTCPKCRKQMKGVRGIKLNPAHVLYSCGCGYKHMVWLDRYTGKGNDYALNGN